MSAHPMGQNMWMQWLEDPATGAITALNFHLIEPPVHNEPEPRDDAASAQVTNVQEDMISSSSASNNVVHDEEEEPCRNCLRMQCVCLSRSDEREAKKEAFKLHARRIVPNANERQIRKLWRMSERINRVWQRMNRDGHRRGLEHRHL